MFLAMIDLQSSRDALQLIQLAITAALDALPLAALFGIITFSDKVDN